MKKKIFLASICVIMSLLASCGSKEKIDSSTSDVQTEKKDKSIYFENSIDYIVCNQVFDYSEFFDKVYDWGYGIKLPIEKPENSEIKWQEENYPHTITFQIAGLEKQKFEDYLETLKKAGFSLYAGENEYKLYKDNFRINFKLDEYRNEYAFFAYMGNVFEEREVTRKEAREIIEQNKLLADNEEFAEYYVFVIENETVREQGYYEFLIEPVFEKEIYSESRLPYYLLTDGENVLLFEQNILHQSMPSNVNIIKEDDAVKLVSSSYVLENGYFCSYVRGYVLTENKFVQEWLYHGALKYDIVPHEEMIISLVKDNKLETYIVSPKKDYDFTLGMKDYWTVVKQYNVEKEMIER